MYCLSGQELSTSATPTAAPALDQPTNLLGFSCFLLQPFQHRVCRRILPIPPTPTVFDQRMVDVSAIQQEDVSKGAPVSVLAVGLKDNISSKD